jgi:hypothetical protein
MILIDAGTWDQVLEQCGTYYPEAEYFIVDYLDKDKCSQIRLPFLRQEKVFQVCILLYQAIKGGASINSPRGLPEYFLDKPYAKLDVAEEAIAAGVEDAKFLDTSTREVLFEWRYEAIAKRFKSKALRSIAEK